MTRLHKWCAELCLWRAVQEIKQASRGEADSDRLAADEAYDGFLALLNSHEAESHQMLDAMASGVNLFITRQAPKFSQDFELIARAIE